jgi:uncharacterized protein (DUF1778 family)
LTSTKQPPDIPMNSGRTAKSVTKAGGRTATINLRIEPGTRELIDAAADALGKSRTEFMIDSARRDAVDVLLDQRLFALDPAQFETFAAALDNPPPAGPKLKALMKRRPAWQR